MKKSLSIAAILLWIIVLSAGCGVNNSGKSDPGPTKAAPETSQSIVNQTQSSAGKIGTDYNTLSLDLTTFSPTEASDVAHKISEHPHEFVGSTIKLRGQYEAAENYNTGTYIHAVTVTNQDLCCPAVIEFIWKGEHTYPEDYPKEFTEIEVEGVMKHYQEADQIFYYLDVDDITVL